VFERLAVAGRRDVATAPPSPAFDRAHPAGPARTSHTEVRVRLGSGGFGAVQPLLRTNVSRGPRPSEMSGTPS
jgi:hypothetical protein